jgi:hypothetical protein
MGGGPIHRGHGPFMGQGERATNRAINVTEERTAIKSGPTPFPPKKRCFMPWPPPQFLSLQSRTLAGGEPRSRLWTAQEQVDKPL